MWTHCLATSWTLPSGVVSIVLAQMVVDAVELEGRSLREVANFFGVSKSWAHKVVQRHINPVVKAPEGAIHDVRHVPFFPWRSLHRSVLTLSHRRSDSQALIPNLRAPSKGALRK